MGGEHDFDSCSEGAVKLTDVISQLAHEHVQAPLIRNRHHQTRDLVVSSLQSEPWRYRRLAGGTGYQHKPRIDSLWRTMFGPKFARRLGRRNQGFGDTFLRGRGLRQDQGRTALSVAGGRPKRGCSRCFSAGSTGWQGRRAILQGTDSTSRRRTQENRHRQTGKLPSCPSEIGSRFVSRYGPARPQRGGAIAPTDKDSRPGYEAMQKCCAGPALPESAFSHLQPVQSGAPHGRARPLSGPETTRLCVRDTGCASLIDKGNVFAGLETLT